MHPGPQSYYAQTQQVDQYGNVMYCAVPHCNRMTLTFICAIFTSTLLYWLGAKHQEFMRAMQSSWSDRAQTHQLQGAMKLKKRGSTGYKAQ